MWTSNKMIALYILLGLVVAAVVAWFLLRKTVRTRLSRDEIDRYYQDSDAGN